MSRKRPERGSHEDAIYALRDAAEAHGRAEERLMNEPTAEGAGRLAESRQRVEAATADAIERLGEDAGLDDNVVNVDFTASRERRKS